MQLLVSHLYYETAEVLEPLAEHALPVLRNIYLLETANVMKKFSKRITLKKYKMLIVHPGLFESKLGRPRWRLAWPSRIPQPRLDPAPLLTL